MREQSINPRPFVYLLGLGGANTGVMNHAADYSTPDDAYIQATGKWHVHSLTIGMVDEKVWEAEDFGSTTALTTGLKVIVKRSGVEEELTAGHRIKENHDVELYFGPNLKNGYTNTTNEAMTCTWTFSSDLVLNAGDQLIVRLSDNLTALIDLYFMAHGHTYEYAD